MLHIRKENGKKVNKRKYAARILALFMTCLMVLSLASCQDPNDTRIPGGKKDASEKGDFQIHNLNDHIVSSQEIETLNPLHTQIFSDIRLMFNLYDPLVCIDSESNLIPGLALSWESEDDGQTWTIHLREDAVWSDNKGNVKGNVTSRDILTGLEWVLNSHKNDSIGVSIPNEIISGAEDYYKMTSSLSQEEAYSISMDKFMSTVGIEAPDDYTVIYHCKDKIPYFPTILVQNCLLPAPTDLISQVGVDGYLSIRQDNMWVYGPYLLTEFVPGNEKILKANPNWWGTKDHKIFDSITIKAIDSEDFAYSLYQTADVDSVALSEAILSTISRDPDHPLKDYLIEGRRNGSSHFFTFCFNKKKEDGSPDDNWNKAINNEAFRLSIYYGLDTTNYLKCTNSIHPLGISCEYITAEGICKSSDGRDYTELVMDKLGINSPANDDTDKTIARYNKDLGQKYKAQAMDELKKIGVTFPVELDFYVQGGSQSAVDEATILKDSFNACLGSDYIKFNIKTYVN